MSFKAILKSCLLQPQINFLLTHGLKLLIGSSSTGFLKHLADKLPIVPDRTSSIAIDGIFTKFYARGAIGRELFWTGNYPEKTSLSIYLYLVQYASIVFDIGANVGLFSICGAVANPRCRIFAFEPVPYVRAILKSNVELNKLNNVVIRGEALGLKNTGKVKLYVSDDDTMSSIIPTDTAKNVCEVSCTTLDAFCEVNNIVDNVDLIKIDVEGAELLVFDGGKILLQHCKPTILCEVLEDNVADGLNDIFVKLDYKFYNVTSGGLKQSDLIFASTNIGNRNWLLVHKMQRHVIDGYMKQ